MEKIHYFFDAWQKGEKYEGVNAETISHYETKLPSFLIEMWKENGLSHFNDGFWLTVNPNDYSEIMSWFVSNPSDKIPVLRTAFGGLIYLDLKPQDEFTYFYLCPIKNQVIPLSDRLEDVFNSWLTTDFLYEPLMFYPVYHQARLRLPIVKPDECYGFVPAIGLGGELNASNVTIQNLKAHLNLLSQIG